MCGEKSLLQEIDEVNIAMGINFSRGENAGAGIGNITQPPSPASFI